MLRRVQVPCGANSFAKAACQAPKMLDVPASSRMNSFPHGLHGIQKLWELACLRSGEAGAEDAGCAGLFANEFVPTWIAWNPKTVGAGLPAKR
jgi:hypothetical protein